MDTPNFRQLCVWPGTTLGDETSEYFESWLSKEFGGARFKFAEVVKTLPDVEDGERVSGTGGRSDILFYIHCDDIGKFAVQRLGYGIRWWEDALANDPDIYSNDVKTRYLNMWKSNDPTDDEEEECEDEKEVA